MRQREERMDGTEANVFVYRAAAETTKRLAGKVVIGTVRCVVLLHEANDGEGGWGLVCMVQIVHITNSSKSTENHNKEREAPAQTARSPGVAYNTSK